MATVSLCFSILKNPLHWTSKNVDKILNVGNILFNTIGKFCQFLPSDIPHSICMYGSTYHLTQLTSYIGMFKCSDKEFQLPTFDMLSPIFSTYQYFLVVIGNSAISIAHAGNETFFVFDSHSRDINGLPAYDGTAVLLNFHDMFSLQNYIKKIVKYFKHKPI